MGDRKPPESFGAAVLQLIWGLQDRRRRAVLAFVIGCVVLFAIWSVLPEPIQLGVIGYFANSPQETAEQTLASPKFVPQEDGTVLVVFVVPSGWGRDKALHVAINKLDHYLAQEFPELDLQQRDALRRSRVPNEHEHPDQFAFLMTPSD